MRRTAATPKRKKINRGLLSLFCSLFMSLCLIYVFHPDIESGKFGVPRRSFDTNSLCRCVNCKEDHVCGGLWKAVNYEGGRDDIQKIPIHIVVSHCENDLSWMSKFIEGFNVRSIHVMTKCGKPVLGLPHGAKVVPLPNQGRCDHSYLKYITTVLDASYDDDSIVIFVKDDISSSNEHQQGHWNDLRFIVRVASSSNGFSCGITHGIVGGRFDISAYHTTRTLLQFSLETYKSRRHSYEEENVQFHSRFYSLGEFYEYITKGGLLAQLPQITQVCYGGFFGARVSNIRSVNMTIWRNAESALLRGNNIEEGHFMERLWAALLANPLELYQMKALVLYSHQIPTPPRFKRSHWGCLLREVTFHRKAQGFDLGVVKGAQGA